MAYPKNLIPRLLPSELLVLALLPGDGQPAEGAGAEYAPLGPSVCLGEAAGHTYMDHPYSMRNLVLLFFFPGRKTRVIDLGTDIICGNH